LYCSRLFQITLGGLEECLEINRILQLNLCSHYANVFYFYFYFYLFFCINNIFVF
jgi:hypothetical protein